MLEKEGRSSSLLFTLERRAMAAPQQQLPQLQQQHRKVSLKFRCLMGALTVLVVCVMTFNIFWLHTVIQTQQDGEGAHNGDLFGSPNNHIDGEVIMAHEIKPFMEGCDRRKSLEDIQRCFPSEIVRKLSPDCQEIKDWEHLQDCLTGRFRNGNKAVRHVHIVGERHSGTKFLTSQLQKCFPRRTRFSFRVHRDFIRSKHFFQPILDQDLSQSIIVVIVRDPVDWVAAMREKPYHSPFHMKGFNDKAIPLDWHDFVTRPWTMPRLPGWENRTDDSDPKLCQDNFHREEVVPCEYNESSGLIPDNFFRGFYPLYEMQRDGSGRPFSSIIDLRNEKIVNFVLELPMLTDVAGFMVVRYEDILLKGMDFVLKRLQKMLRLPDKAMNLCKNIPPQPDRLKARAVADDFRKYIVEHMDSHLESLLGYV